MDLTTEHRIGPLLYFVEWSILNCIITYSILINGILRKLNAYKVSVTQFTTYLGSKYHVPDRALWARNIIIPKKVIYTLLYYKVFIFDKATGYFMLSKKPKNKIMFYLIFDYCWIPNTVSILALNEFDKI